VNDDEEEERRRDTTTIIVGGKRNEIWEKKGRNYFVAELSLQIVARKGGGEKKDSKYISSWFHTSNT